MAVNSDDRLRKLLSIDHIAVVGCSTTPGKAAHDIPKYMLDRGYEITPVNPYADEIFGREACDTLSEVPGGIELVDVFRPSDEVPGIVDEAIRRDDVKTVWLQLGITHDEAGERVQAAGKAFVQDRCLKVEHERLFE